MGDHADWYRKWGSDAAEYTSYQWFDTEPGSEGATIISNDQPFVYVGNEEDKNNAINDARVEKINSSTYCEPNTNNANLCVQPTTGNNSNVVNVLPKINEDESAKKPDQENENTQSGELISVLWYSNAARKVVPDKISIGLGADVMFYFGGGAEPLNVSILTRGKSGEPGLYMTPTISSYAGFGSSYSGGLNFTFSNYSGNPHDISADMMPGISNGFYATGGYLGNLGVGISKSNTGNGEYFINGSLSIGLGGGAWLGYQRQETVSAIPIFKF